MNKPLTALIVFAATAALSLACLGCSSNEPAAEEADLEPTDTPATEETVKPADDAEADKAAEDTTEDAAKETATESTEDTAKQAADSSTGLPAYNGDTATMEGAIENYLIATYSSNYDASDVWIPITEIVKTDDSDANDIKCWGSYWIMGYNLNGTTLECTSGGNYPGCVHLTKAADGTYQATSMDLAVDGAEWYDSLVQICGGDSDLADQISAATDLSAEPQFSIRTDTIRAYAQNNGLDVTAYQDYGWDPVSL